MGPFDSKGHEWLCPLTFGRKVFSFYYLSISSGYFFNCYFINIFQT